MAVTMNYGAAPTYVKLASQTLASAAATVTFSNIPQGYTDLVLVVNELNSTATNTSFQFQVGNGSVDTGANYSLTELFGTGSAASSDRATNDTAAYFNGPGIGVSTTTPNAYVMNFMNYSNTNTYKTFLGRGGSADKNTVATVNLWRSTSPINTIKIFQSANNMAAGTTFTIYGIKAASIETKGYATGGTLFSDATYYYHVFKQSDVFIPAKALSCDVLVVAGGGSGGSDVSGGGGAGGVIAFASQSISTAQTVIIGAGGAGLLTKRQTGNNGVNSSFGALTAAVGGGPGSATENADGGSGGGKRTASGGAATSGQGNVGGGGSNSGPHYPAGGGGGAGSAGSAGVTSTGGSGGAGTNSVTNWGALSAALTATGLGVSGYIAGGGGAGSYTTAGAAGSGGATAGGVNVTTLNATANTGSGSGGTTDPSYGTGNGGSGVVIVRYTK